jgi:hypothetical protein
MRALALALARLLARIHLLSAADVQYTRQDRRGALDVSAREAESEPSQTCERQWLNAIQDFPRESYDRFPMYRGDGALSGGGTAVLFVHVGKTCGTTVVHTLHRSEALIRQSFPDFEALVHVHVHPVRRAVLATADNVVIAVRDPVARFISAYNTVACLWDGAIADPDICLRRPGRLLTETLTPSSNFSIGKLLTSREMRLMQCFPNVTAFAAGLDDESECGRAARDALGTQATALAPSHIGRGVCYYLGGLLEELRRKRVHLVNTESCDADIAAIPPWLGLNSSFKLAKEVHTGRFPHHDDEPSREGRSRLRRHLAHEYALHEELERLEAKRLYD